MYMTKFMLFRISFLRMLIKIVIVICTFHISLPFDTGKKTM